MTITSGLRRHGRLLGAVLLAAGLAAACSDDDDDDSGVGDLEGADAGDCISVDMAVSSEKIALPSGDWPLTNMWWPHTRKLRRAIAIDE